MIALYDEMIFNDFRNQIIGNFLEMFREFAAALGLIAFIAALIALVVIIKKFPNRNNSHDWRLGFAVIFIPVCIMFICKFGLKVCYEKYLDTHPNELNWNISIETVYYKEDIYSGGLRNKRYRNTYYLYFNQEKNDKNKIKVKEEIFGKVKKGEKMYVVRNSENNIILVYSMKDYKYVKDEQLKDN